MPNDSLLFICEFFGLGGFGEWALAVGLLNRPQRKPLSRTESGILKVNKINPAIVTSTDERFVLSKGKGGE